MCGAMTLTTYSQGFFVGPVTEEFGWSIAQFFLGFTVMSLLGLFAAPLVGSLAQKYGIRTLGIAGLIGHALGYILLSFNPNSLPLWYLTWALISFLAAGSLPIIWTSVLNGWFVKNRGKAVGITMAGTGIGAFLLPPIVEFLIADYGWRFAYRAIGAGAMLIALPFVFFWFQEKPSGPVEGTENPAQSWGLTRKEALRTGKFWTLAVVLLLTVFVVVGLLANFEQILSEKGYERGTIAIFAALLGISVIVARVGVGALVDRFWAPAVAAVAFIIPIMGILLIIYAPPSMAVGVGIAVAIGIASGAELDLLAYLTSKYFGPRNYTEIFGGIFAMFAIGAGVAPPIFGAMAESTGSYHAPLYLGMGCLAMTIVLYLSLGRYPDEALREGRVD
ncbi:MAG: MFS transporter [Marinomonas sp.]